MKDMSLARLFEGALPAHASSLGEIAERPAGGIRADSRAVCPGDVFVVVRGSREDGAQYAADAVERGAAVIVASGEADVGVPPVPVVRVADARGALALLAAERHGQPSREMTVVGVTGTNGKTTTTHLVRGALEHAGRGPCALLGTIVYEWPGEQREAPNTTPGADVLHEVLGLAHAAGATSAALEVSSHALDQRRTEGVRFAGAVFTNVSGDHLDYHGSMEDYAEAKAQLFRGLDAGAVVAINVEDGYAPTMLRGCAARVVRYGLDAPAAPDVTARELEMASDGVRFTLVTPDGDAPVRSSLLGRYNVMNLLGAAAVLTGLGMTAAQVAAGLGSVAGVRGRLEPVDEGQPFSVLVDYAHTDDAVTNVLRNLRAVVPGRLLCVVGCGGDRDRTKRPRMARAAAELSEVCWFTSDNPRTEEPQGILDDMLGGVYGARNVRVEIDRRTAIGLAIGVARVGDCVAILGKGHEDYQVLGTTKVPFDDRDVAAAALRDVLEASGTPLRTR